MQFLTAKTVLYVRLAGLTCVCFFLLKKPQILVNANITVLLGRAMNLPIVQATPSNPLFGVLAVAIALLVVGDLVPVLADNVVYFETLVPTRLLFFFVLASFCLVSDYAVVANNLVFSYLFLEIWLNFLVFNNLRDEKYYRAKEYLETHGAELREMADAQVMPIGEDR
ncbi:hypothetical protein METBIDRAFT_39784 [Metschnikowia bicuspidata var. bicuspidata NRRL YB-4993]|uniref:Uncharacterized protein n=1 Tax=Metschnikowia bicuspidata var. bicuspidata NRRL YB-4993 TaxID=869754 RepID=A0A1A0HF10_9ASCO|nr:hypothetical protein METBIDRAFT_39784 [Metschnikowia bicuspidata var. bicuspidata NRRL YB-4993]OBA22482.1 hypothetical protein METBIDRAFT_39784 [Metschnikowia bicuspidata var. bicuspidata NRRL YB-4993]